MVILFVLIKDKVNMSELTDEDIAKAVQKGNIDLFGELVGRYEVKLKRYGRRFLSGEDDIEDLVQDALIKAYENIQSFKTSMRFSPWMYRIAHNTFVNALKKQSKYGVSVFDPDVILPFLPAKETADQDTLDAELKKEIDALLESLPAKYREVIVLHYIEELSYKEISEVLKIPTTTVGVRIMRAKKQLQKMYKDFDK